MTDGFRCPHCDSENTTKVALEYNRGTKTTVGVAASLHGVGLGAATSQSGLSDILAPPKAPRIGGVMTAFGCGLLLLLVGLPMTCFGDYSHGDNDGPAWAIAGVICIGVGFLFAMLKRPAEDEYQKRLNVWNATMLCLRCGHRWVSDAVS